MSSALHRRLARLEAALMPAPEQGFTVLIEPDLEARGAEWQAHRQAIDAAWLRGDRVGVVRSPDSVDHDQPEVGIEYFETEFHAWLAVLAGQKSLDGTFLEKKNIAAAATKSIPTNV